MLLTSVVPTVPDPFPTVQVWTGRVGLVLTVTAYVAPGVSIVLKWKAPFEVIVSASPPLFCRTSPAPDRPVTVAPIENELVVQLIDTFVTFVTPMVPDGFVTVQVWLGPVGCALTVTLYAVPPGDDPEKVNVPLLLTGRLDDPFCRTNPEPVNPVTVPPTV